MSSQSIVHDHGALTLVPLLRLPAIRYPRHSLQYQVRELCATGFDHATLDVTEPVLMFYARLDK